MFGEIEKYGHWEGDQFVLNELRRIRTEFGVPITIGVIDFSGVVIPEGVTREELVSAMLNPETVSYAWDPDADVDLGES